MGKLVPQMRVQRLHVTVPQFREEAAEVGRLLSFEWVQQQTAEWKVELPLLPEATVEAARFTPHERVQQRPAEHSVGWVFFTTLWAPNLAGGADSWCTRAADCRKAEGEVPKISSKDLILQSTREQFLDVPVPLMTEVPKISSKD